MYTNTITRNWKIKQFGVELTHRCESGRGRSEHEYLAGSSLNLFLVWRYNGIGFIHRTRSNGIWSMLNEGETSYTMLWRQMNSVFSRCKYRRWPSIRRDAYEMQFRRLIMLKVELSSRHFSWRRTGSRNLEFSLNWKYIKFYDVPSNIEEQKFSRTIRNFRISPLPLPRLLVFFL